MQINRLALGLTALLAAAAVIIVVENLPDRFSGAPYQAAAPPVDAAAHDFSLVADRVGRSVVNISRIPPELSTLGDTFPDSSGHAITELNRRNLGSGFIVHSQGYILTSSRVAYAGVEFVVKMSDRRTEPAVVVGADPASGIAVLKIDSEGLPALPLADSDTVAVGDWVAAFGSPFGLEQSMTAGIVSAKGRIFRFGHTEEYLQTDAAINPGDSGGPVVNLRGEVIGISTTIQGRNYAGLGFAIPAATVRRVYHRILKTTEKN